MKAKHEEVIKAEKMNVFSSSLMTWMLLGIWLAYSAVMLWHLKEQANLNVSVCKVAR